MAELSCHDHGNCELCDRIERENAELRERLKRLREAAREHLEYCADASAGLFRDALAGCEKGEDAERRAFRRLRDAARDCIHWAQGLIEQMPEEHEGAQSWLLNYGDGEKCDRMRERWEERVGKRGTWSQRRTLSGED